MSGLADKLADIRLVAFDVDGVFTDGRFYLSDDGVESKAFNTQDGFGIRQLISAGIAVAVISGRKSLAVERRMKELGVPHLVQGSGDKVAALDAIHLDAQENLSAGINCAYSSATTCRILPLLEHVGLCHRGRQRGPCR